MSRGDVNMRDLLAHEAGMKDRRMSPVDELAIQTCYASARVIEAHLRQYFESGRHHEIPLSVFEAAGRIAAVLDGLRGRSPVSPSAGPMERLEAMGGE